MEKVLEEIRSAIVERRNRLKDLISDPMLEPESSSYRYEHRVMAGELDAVLKIFDKVRESRM